MDRALTILTISTAVISWGFSLGCPVGPLNTAFHLVHSLSLGVLISLVLNLKWPRNP